jgi:hypothetical protein
MYTDDAVFSFGSTKNLNDLIDGSSEESTRISPQFTILNQDTNKDGIADQIELKFTVNTDGSKIRNIAIVQSIVYSIDSKISADIKSFLVNSFSTTNGLSKMVAQGQINLV